jgi:hypothetical protein
MNAVAFIMKGANNVNKHSNPQRIIVLDGEHKGKLGSVVTCIHLLRLPTVYIVRVDGVGSVEFSGNQIRPVKAGDFQVGDRVVTERIGHAVVKEVHEDCVQVQTIDGRCFCVLPEVLCFEVGYKRHNAEQNGNNEFKPRIVVSTNNDGKMVVSRLGTNPDDFVLVDYTEETIKEDITKAVDQLLSVWPTKGDTFYFVKLHDGDVKAVKGVFNPEGNMSQSCVAMGNIYRTEEEANAAARKIRTVFCQEIFCEE